MRTVRVLVGLVALVVPAPSEGQTPAAPAAPPFTAGWNDGFVLQSANGDYRFVLGVAAQTDGRFVLGDSQHRVTDTFTIRKMRPTVTGNARPAQPKPAP